VDGFQKKQSADQNRERDPKLRVSEYAFHPTAGLITGLDWLHVVVVQAKRLREMSEINKRLGGNAHPRSGPLLV
jgi:hypothetical protein